MRGAGEVKTSSVRYDAPPARRDAPLPPGSDGAARRRRRLGQPRRRAADRGRDRGRGGGPRGRRPGRDGDRPDRRGADRGAAGKRPRGRHAVGRARSHRPRRRPGARPRGAVDARHPQRRRVRDGGAVPARRRAPRPRGRAPPLRGAVARLVADAAARARRHRRAARRLRHGPDRACHRPPPRPGLRHGGPLLQPQPARAGAGGRRRLPRQRGRPPRGQRLPGAGRPVDARHGAASWTPTPSRGCRAAPWWSTSRGAGSWTTRR